MSWTLDDKPGPSATSQIKPLQEAHIKIAASLPGTGAYQSTISLTYNDSRHVVPLKVTRNSAQPTISVQGLDAAAFDWCNNERTIHFSLKETSGIPVTLHHPALTALTRKTSEKTLQAPYTSAKVFRITKDKGEEEVGESFNVAANESVPMVLKLTGVNSPGEYNGSLDFSSVDGSLPAQTFGFYIKRSWLLCAILIALGVLASHWLRNYAKAGRPRLILGRRIVLLQMDINQLGDRLPEKEEKDILAFFRQRIDRANADIEIGETSKVEGVLDDINAKLNLVPLWSNLRTRLDAVRPPTDGDEARPALQKAKEFLIENDQAKTGEIKSMAETIRDAFGKIDLAVRKRLQGDIEQVKRLATDAKAVLSQVRQNEFDAKVLTPLAAAVTSTQKSPPDDVSARSLINDAGCAYASILANELEEKITLMSRPTGLEQAEWDGVIHEFKENVGKARSATGGAAAVLAYEDTYASYLKVLIRVALETLKEVQGRAGTAKKTDIVQELARAMQLLEIALDRLRNREFNEAKESYNTAKNIIDDAVRTVPAAAQTMEYAPGQPGPRPQPSELFSASTILRLPGLANLGRFDDPQERRQREWEQLDQIQSLVKTRDRFVSGSVAIAAILIGLYSIWSESLTWGSGKDMFAAIFWGLGVHQIAGNVLFAKLDLENLETQLTGKKAVGSGNANS
jgi:hypothetical protein